tara:strand:+ start:1625 stop:2272 length:648 start_codon:yes stop_codon:yes gene_type:complete
MSKTAVRSYTDEQLLNRVQTLENFKGFPEGRWIIGVRSNEDIPNTYDDKFYEYENQTFIRVMTGTTNSGTPQLKGGFRAFNKYGSAILKANKWYHNVWSYGLHRGKMPSLRQVGNKVTVYRDGNMNSKSEELGSPITGWYGINYHTNTYDFSKASLKIFKWFIGNWSAGCQVVNNREKYFEQMDYYRWAKNAGIQKYVTYVLIDEFEPNTADYVD